MRCFLRIVGVLFLLTQTPFTQIAGSNADDFEKMSFDAVTDKTKFIPLEPITVKFRFSNRTQESLTALPPDYLSDVKIKVTYDGKPEVSGISMIRANIRRFPRAFNSGASVEGEVILDTNLDTLFPSNGVYQIQFLLGDGKGGKKALKSKPIEIRIDEPTGIDREALDFMYEYQRFSGTPQILFSWNDTKDEDGRNLLERFVREYGETIYGEHAIYSLGTFYLHYKQDLEKAKVELSKISASRNNIIAIRAKESLAEIETRIKERERRKLPKDESEKLRP